MRFRERSSRSSDIWITFKSDLPISTGTGGGGLLTPSFPVPRRPLLWERGLRGRGGGCFWPPHSAWLAKHAWVFWVHTSDPHFFLWRSLTGYGEKEIKKGVWTGGVWGYSLTGKTLILHINISGSIPDVSILSSWSSIGRAKYWSYLGYKFKSYLEHKKGDDEIGKHGWFRTIWY